MSMLLNANLRMRVHKSKNVNFNIMKNFHNLNANTKRIGGYKDLIRQAKIIANFNMNQEQRFLSKISTKQFTSKQEANSKGSQKLSDSINGINQVHKIDNGEGNDEDSAKIEDLEKRIPPPTSISIVNYSKFHGEDHSTVIISPDRKEQQYIPQKIHFKYSKKELGESLAYYFLPNGYPHSVNTGYLKFSLLFGLSAFSITCLSFISTQCLFVALGSTTTKASLYSAAYTWVLKDGIGQLGAILFAGKYGKNFDEDVKKWRFM